MMRPKVYIVLFAAALALPFAACKPRYDYKAQVVLLDSLQQTWGAEFEQGLAAMPDSLVQWRDTALLQLQLVQSQYTGKMKKSRATDLSRYHLVIDVSEEVEHDMAMLRDARKLEEHRITILSKALSERADKDAQGNIIDPTYVAKALQAEENAHALLMQRLKNVGERKQIAGEIFHELYPLMKHMTDSLSLKD